MLRKLLVIVLCGFVHNSACSRMRYEQGFYEPLYRNDPSLHGEPMYKREHFFPREHMVQQEQMLAPQGVIRNEPIYGNEGMLPPPPQQQQVIHGDEYLQNEQIIQSEPLMRGDAFIREPIQPILRREPIIRREPILRREPFFRNDVIRGGRFFQSAPVIRDGGILRSEPNGYTVMLAPCPCQSEPQNMGSQDTLLQIPQQMPMPQPMQIQQQQPIITHRIIYPKPIMKQQAYPPMVAFPRMQRFVRKGFRPLPENIQFSPPQVPNTQEFNSFNNEPVPFPGNFQSQAPPQENTSEPGQNNPVTVRSVPQMANPLALAQMSSIC